MNIVNPKEAMMQSLHDACNFNLYRKTLELTKNIATDVEFQKNFTNYYRVRRDADWLHKFYSFFEENKNNKTITFEEILRYLSNIEHNVKQTTKNPTGKAKTVEASFASKMLATINPSHPIWDSQVLHYLNIEVDGALCHEDKIEECIKVYQKIERDIATFIASVDGLQCIEVFDKVFPSCKNFSDYKKIDFFLWNLGK